MCVRGGVSEGLCQRVFVRGGVSEECSQRGCVRGGVCKEVYQRWCVRGGVSEEVCQREKKEVKEDEWDSDEIEQPLSDEVGKKMKILIFVI